MTKARTCLDNYINGNLSDAKRLAKQAGRKAIINELTERNYSIRAIRAIVAYLLDGGSFQAAADAEMHDKLANDTTP